MTVRRVVALAALGMAVTACNSTTPSGAAAPTPTPTTTVTQVVAVPVPVASPEMSGSLSGKGVAPKPDPALCGADNLMPYLNLLPTSTAKDEIAKTVGHNRIRYVQPGQAITQEFRPDRLTVELGVDGRIKQFRCG